MRNSKVRQRIAAGKLKLRIRDLRNLGVKSEQILAEIGIWSADELRRQGAVRTFAELRRAGPAPSLNMLWALAGALDPWPEGTHWREIARGESRLSLLLAVDDLEAPAARRPVTAQAGRAKRAKAAGRGAASS
jgi:DNA transformation protein and related proteins